MFPLDSCKNIPETKNIGYIFVLNKLNRSENVCSQVPRDISYDIHDYCSDVTFVTSLPGLNTRISPGTM